MKKSILVIAALASFMYAAAPTAPTLYGPLSWECVVSNNIANTGNSQGWSSTGKDTLVGTDSIFLVKNYKLEPGYSYVAQILDSCNADTIKIFSNTYGSDGSTLMSSVSVDSIKSDLSKTVQQIQLGSGLTVFGSRLNVIAYSYRATLKRLIKRFELYRVKSSLAR
jgi:hypothetical protein